MKIYLRHRQLLLGWALQADRETTPIITGGKARYYVNDVLVMNCTSPPHNAQLSSLKWFINADEAEEKQLIWYNNDPTKGLVLGLRFVMEQQYFQLTELKLRCVAIYHRTIAGKLTAFISKKLIAFQDNANLICTYCDYLLKINSALFLFLPLISAEFQEHLIFRAYNSEIIQAQSASLAHSIFLMQGRLAFVHL